MNSYVPIIGAVVFVFTIILCVCIVVYFNDHPPTNNAPTAGSSTPMVNSSAVASASTAVASASANIAAAIGGF